MCKLSEKQWNTCRAPFSAPHCVFVCSFFLIFQLSILIFTFPLIHLYPLSASLSPPRPSLPPTPTASPLPTRSSLFSQIFQILFFQTGRLSLCAACIYTIPETVSFFGWSEAKCSWRGAYNALIVWAQPCSAPSWSGAVGSICWRHPRGGRAVWHCLHYRRGLFGAYGYFVKVHSRQIRSE